MTTVERILPAHIEQTVEAIATLHAQHERESTPIQRLVGRATTVLGKPRGVATITGFIVVWVLYNTFAAPYQHAFDPAPFEWLQAVVSLTALYVTLFILTTQQRDDVIAGYREQLTLELAILGEQKSAKIIELLESMRRDNPLIEDRIDAEAIAMSMPADPQAVLEAIRHSTGTSFDESGDDGAG